MDISNISWVGVIAAAVAAFVVGGIYYGVLGKPWMKAARIDPSQAKMSAALFITSILAELVMAIFLSMLIVTLSMGDSSVTMGLMTGFVVWLGFILTTLIINHRYQGFGWDLTLIDGLHWLLVMLVQGAIIGYFGMAMTV